MRACLLVWVSRTLHTHGSGVHAAQNARLVPARTTMAELCEVLRNLLLLCDLLVFDIHQSLAFLCRAESDRTRPALIH